MSPGAPNSQTRNAPPIHSLSSLSAHRAQKKREWPTQGQPANAFGPGGIAGTGHATIRAFGFAGVLVFRRTWRQNWTRKLTRYSRGQRALAHAHRRSRAAAHTQQVSNTDTATHSRAVELEGVHKTPSARKSGRARARAHTTALHTIFTWAGGCCCWVRPPQSAAPARPPESQLPTWKAKSGQSPLPSRPPQQIPPAIRTHHALLARGMRMRRARAQTLPPPYPPPPLPEMTAVGMHRGSRSRGEGGGDHDTAALDACQSLRPLLQAAASEGGAPLRSC